MTAMIISLDTIGAAPARRIVRPIPTIRLVKIELRKMFNTRSGFWMLVSIGVLSVIATGAVLIFAPDSEIAYENFAAAIGFPMSVILPMIAILGVTSEWSQRSGLTTFTLVPSRGRVIGAKAFATFVVGVVSMAPHVLTIDAGPRGTASPEDPDGPVDTWPDPNSRSDLTKDFGDLASATRGPSTRSTSTYPRWVAGFVGPNAAGKSTTIRMLRGLITPTSGDGEVLGHPIGRPDDYLHRVGALIGRPRGRSRGRCRRDA